MMRVRERRPEQRIQAQVKAQKQEQRGRVKQDWKANRKGAKERIDGDSDEGPMTFGARLLRPSE
jgi:hypothetical protein